MLASLANIFRIPDLRKKVLFTLTIIALYQFGANVPVPFVNFSKVAQLSAASKSSGVLGFLNLFSGGRAHPHGRLRARDHALHHLEHHHPAPGDGDPQARGVARPGCGRPEEAHPDHPLPHRRARAHAVDRPGLPLPQGRRRALRDQPVGRLDPQLLDLARGLHRAHLDRGHRLRDVAGGADHPAGYRTRDVDPDLRQRGRRHPFRAQHGPPGGRAAQVLDRDPGVAGLVGAHRLRRPGPTADPGHLRQAGGRPQDVRRLEHLHPAQGQPGGRDPDHLRQLGALHPGPALERDPLRRVPETG